MKTKNPFTILDYQKPKYFCNRKNELESVFENIKLNKSIILKGRKEVGKTFFLKHIDYLCKKQLKWNSKYFPLKSIESVSELIPHFKNEKSLNYYHQTNHESSEVAETKNILIMDDADLVLEKDHDNFVGLFRDFLTINFNIIILSLKEKEINEIEMDTIILDSIPEDEQKEFFTNWFSRKNVKITNKAFRYLHKLTGGNIYLAKILCSKLWNREHSKIKPAIIDGVYSELLVDSTPGFDLVLQVLSAYQVKLLKAIANEGKAIKVTSQEFIKKYQLNAPSSVKTAIYSLTDKGIIHKNENFYSLQNPLFEQWLNNI